MSRGLRWTPEQWAAHRAEKAQVKAEKPKRAPAHTWGQMNKLERSFYEEWLKPRMVPPCVPMFERVTLKIGEDCRLTPDFYVPVDFGHEVYEVKGPRAYEDSIIKLKAAATQFPWITFYLCRRLQGQWDIKHIRAPEAL